ncbi:MAG: hypothetical protein JSU06_08520 [Actinobacteria bacterium]|nr:hypothetical protein [Actinomycetota bacterium]
MTGRTTISLLLATTVVALALTVPPVAGAQVAAPAWRVLAATGPTNLPPVTKEVQRVAVDASGGTFTLAFEGESTAPLAYDSGPGAIESALDAVPAIAAVGGRLTVTGGPGNPGGENPYFVSFGGGLAGHDVPELVPDQSGLQGGGSTVTVSTSVAGAESFEGGSLAVSVTNVGGASADAIPALTVSLGPLPTGIESRPVGEEGWNCPAAAEGTVLVCSYSGVVPGEESAPTFRVPLTVDGPRASGHSTLPVTVTGGGAEAESDLARLVVSATPAGPGIAAFWAGAFDAEGKPELRAGAHPATASTAFWLNTVIGSDGTQIVPAGAVRTANVRLPPGFVGDPMVTEKRCPQEALSAGAGVESPLCTVAASMVGAAYIAKTAYTSAGFGGPYIPPSPIFNDVPAIGTAAEFTANILNFANVSLLGSLRAAEDFGVTVGSTNLPTAELIYGTLTTLEGFPAAASGMAFLRNPTDCSLQREEAAAGRGPVATLQTNSWANPDPNAIEDEASAGQPAVTGCGGLTEAWVGQGPEPMQEVPTLSLQPESSQASSGTAATAHLHIPQRGLTDPSRLASSDLKKTVVTLPPGLTLNPSAAAGLAACSEAEIGYRGSGFPMPNPMRFDEKPVSCPEASRIGTVDISTPLLEAELHGTIYLAAQDENPFGSLIALYLVVESKRFGVTLKLPGEVRADPGSGQLTATFDDNPQVPFEDLTLHFRGGGPRSQLATPALCGTYRSTGALTPWSAESDSPAEAAPVEEDGFRITSGAGGGACVTSAGALPFSPGFEAGTTVTQAGAYAPLVIRLSRNDGEQELTRLDFSLPAGLTARLAGIPYCPDAAIAAARGKSGKTEQADPSCPAAARIGTVDTAAGVGPEPIHVGGAVYLAGPYGGAPLSAVVVTPAVAGPFDLGDVVVRAPLFVDPRTAQITARAEEIPHILKGIPLQLRSLEIKIDRQDFSLNPTSCNPMAVSSQLGGLDGGSAGPSSRFQVGNCGALAFKPGLKLRLKGATGRRGHPALKAVVTAKPGEAAIARAQVNLPRGEFLDQANLNKACTKPVLLAGNCPSSTIYGRARAWTPLLEAPLEGNVYLVGGYGYKLPALVAELNGQIRILLAGKVDSGANKGIRNTFEVVPDAPVSRFVLEMKGGKKYGLLENSEDLCHAPKARRRALVRFTGQNAKVRAFKPPVAVRCKKSGRPRRGGRGSR